VENLFEINIVENALDSGTAGALSLAQPGTAWAVPGAVEEDET